METLNLIQLPNGETLLPVVLYGQNRHPEVTQWHRRVMVDHFKVGMNYIEAPFHLGVSHGAVMNGILHGLVSNPNPPTYVWFCDNDNVAMQRAAIDLMVRAVQDKMTLWGCAWQSTHKVGKPNGTKQHAYASQACMCFPLSLYRALGMPDCDHHNPRSDTAEELTFEAQFRGYQLNLLYPSRSDTKTTELDNGCWYGRGNVYGPNLWYHESRADLDGHVERFTSMCQRIIAREFEVDTHP